MVKNDKTDPFADLILDEDERNIEAALERGEDEEVPDSVGSKQELESAAKIHRQLNTSKPITLRINQLDLIKIKAKAKRNNIPYLQLLNQ